MADKDDDDDKHLLKSQDVAPWHAGMKVGKGRVSGGAFYDPRDRVLALEGGYEHPVGNRTTLGVQGNYRKNLADPDAKPDYGFGVRGRIRFAQGGSVKSGQDYRKGK